MEREQAISQGRAVQDLLKMEGWTVLKQQIEEEIASAQAELEDIEITERHLQDIGSDFVRLQQLITGLRRTIRITEEIMERYERAIKE